MIFEDYEEKYFDGMDHGEARLKGIKAALDDALQQQDHDAILMLYYEYIAEDVLHGSSYKATIIFPEYVAYFEAHPEKHEDYNHDVMWSYKWILDSISEFYQISLEKVEDLYRQYKDFCKRFNYNLRTYYESLCFFAADNIHKPFLPLALLSEMHSLSRSFEYPCPLSAPETHRQSMYMKPAA